jgi:CRISPR/Cas system CSM-associated protein Csm2 small subunit
MSIELTLEQRHAITKQDLMEMYLKQINWAVEQQLPPENELIESLEEIIRFMSTPEEFNVFMSKAEAIAIED